MMYIFDTSPLSSLFKNYYPKRFPSLWRNFDEIVDSERLVSVREVAREIADGPIQSLTDWAAANKSVFAPPSGDEARIVGEIYKVRHFQQNIEQKKLYNGGKVADPFVIAKACCANGAVVTLEKFVKNGSKIPNICRHFDVQCMSLEEFMEAEGWVF